MPILHLTLFAERCVNVKFTIVIYHDSDTLANKAKKWVQAEKLIYGTLGKNVTNQIFYRHMCISI